MNVCFRLRRHAASSFIIHIIHHHRYHHPSYHHPSYHHIIIMSCHVIITRRGDWYTHLFRRGHRPKAYSDRGDHHHHHHHSKYKAAARHRGTRKNRRRRSPSSVQSPITAIEVFRPRWVIIIIIIIMEIFIGFTTQLLCAGTRSTVFRTYVKNCQSRIQEHQYLAFRAESCG